MIRDRIQSRLRFVLNNAGTKKSATLESYVGCTTKELVEHISSFFTDTLNWETRDQWDIDHIRPCASFDLTDDEQAKVCFNWRNLAPLDSFENYSKGDNCEPLDEAAWSYLMRELGYDGKLFLLFEEGRGGLYGQEAAGEVDT